MRAPAERRGQPGGRKFDFAPEGADSGRMQQAVPLPELRGGGGKTGDHPRQHRVGRFVVVSVPDGAAFEHPAQRAALVLIDQLADGGE